jgi:hypothetical protein
LGLDAWRYRFMKQRAILLKIEALEHDDAVINKHSTALAALLDMAKVAKEQQHHATRVSLLAICLMHLIRLNDDRWMLCLLEHNGL